MTYDRRTFLRRAGLLGAGALTAGVARPAAAADDDLAPFLHGVASGDPTASGVILWTRISGHPGRVSVRWRVATDVDMRDVVASGLASTDADRDHTVKVDATGLSAGTWYFYDFEAFGRRSLVGRTKTAPAGAVDHLRFGVASCSNYQGGFFNAYARLAERDDLDAILHLGDYVYEYGNGDDRYGPGSGELESPRDHVPGHEMVSLADYRQRHAGYKLDPDLRRLHQLLPFVVTWDDHESTNNSWRDGAENHEPEEGAWEPRKAASQQAFAEWLPVRTEDPARVYRVLRYGDLADIVVLDTRLDDRDEQVGEAGVTVVSGEEIDDPERRLIGDEQRAMLFDVLASSTARWRVIAQQVIVGQWNGGGLPQLPDQPDLPRFFLRDGGNALNPDQWDGYTAERDRLFAHIRDNGIEDVVVLTGDVHTSWALDLTEDPYDPTRYNPVTGDGALGVEFVTPSITSANFEILGPAAITAEEGTKADNPHVKWVDFTKHGYYVLDLTAERAQADWFFVDTVLAPSDAETLGASWQAVAGDNHVTEATGPAAEGAAAPAAPPGERAQAAPPTSAAEAPRGTLPATGAGPTGATAAAALLAGAAAAKVLERRARLASPPGDTDQS